VIDTEHPFQVEGISFLPLIVEHGPNYFCLGFRISDFVYISDVSSIPSTTEKLISTNPLDLLVIDALRPNPPHKSHFDVNQAVEVIKRLKPKNSFIVGMGHEVDHDTTNEELAKLKSDGINAEVSYDGMIFSVNLQHFPM